MHSSPGSIVIDSARDAWAHTKATLLTRFNLGLWLKLAFIALLGASVGGGSGGGNFSVPSTSGDDGSPGAEVMQDAMRAVEYVREHIMELLVLIVGLGILWLVIVFGVFYIRCVFRFIFVDAVRTGGRRSIRRAWANHGAQGLSLMLWYIVMGLMTALLVVLAALPVILSAAALASGQTLLAVLGVGGIIVVIGMIALVVVIAVLMQALTQELLVPAMYVRHGGVVDGWRAVFAAWRGRFWDIVLYFLLKMGIGIGVGLAALMVILPMLLLFISPMVTAGLLIGGGVALGLSATQIALYAGPALVVGGVGFMLTFSYIMQCVFLPVNVFMQSYSLAFVGRMDERLRTL